MKPPTKQSRIDTALTQILMGVGASAICWWIGKMIGIA